MGQVYLARDTRLQRSIALKILRPDNFPPASGDQSSNGAARMLREAQAAAALEHANVVTIYEVGEVKGDGEEAGRRRVRREQRTFFLRSYALPAGRRVRSIGRSFSALR